MPAKTKYEFKPGMATREAFRQSAGRAGPRQQRRRGAGRRPFQIHLHRLFAKEFPDRFVECGIAEANMLAIASGLASSGKIPFASSFSCFAINKGFEQLRVTAAYPNVN
jgi:transketolase